MLYFLHLPRIAEDSFFLNLKLCSFVDRYHWLWEACCLCLPPSWLLSYPSTRQHAIASQRTLSLILGAVRAINLTRICAFSMCVHLTLFRAILITLSGSMGSYSSALMEHSLGGMGRMMGKMFYCWWWLCGKINISMQCFLTLLYFHYVFVMCCTFKFWALFAQNKI
jgi:hypothetical protein